MIIIIPFTRAHHAIVHLVTYTYKVIMTNVWHVVYRIDKHMPASVAEN